MVKRKLKSFVVPMAYVLSLVMLIGSVFVIEGAINSNMLKDTGTVSDRVDDSSDEEATTGGSVAEGTVITLTSTTNIRSQMDQSSSKVAVAYSGEKVTVIMSYAEGWTKVKYGNKEGYIRTDLLQQ